MVTSLFYFFRKEKLKSRNLKTRYCVPRGMFLYAISDNLGMFPSLHSPAQPLGSPGQETFTHLTPPPPPSLRFTAGAPKQETTVLENTIRDCISTLSTLNIVAIFGRLHFRPVQCITLARKVRKSLCCVDGSCMPTIQVALSFRCVFFLFSVFGRIGSNRKQICRSYDQLATKALTTTSEEELENRVRALTENLIQKQTLIEALSTDKNSLVLQLERLEVRISCIRYGGSGGGGWGGGGDPHMKRSGMLVVPLRGQNLEFW